MRILDTADIKGKQDMFQVGKKAVISDEIVQFKDEQETKEQDETRGVTLEISEDLREMYQQQAESAKKAADGMKDMAKIMEIARRISRGDKVPASDEKKLIEFDSDLYQAAKAAAMLHANKKHKKYKSLFEEEESEQEQKLRDLRRESESSGSECTGGTEAAAVDAGEESC